MQSVSDGKGPAKGQVRKVGVCGTLKNWMLLPRTNFFFFFVMLSSQNSRFLSIFFLDRDLTNAECGIVLAAFPLLACFTGPIAAAPRQPAPLRGLRGRATKCGVA